MAKKEFIKSAFFKVPSAMVEAADKMFVNTHDDITFVSFAIDEKNNLSLGGNAISQKDGVVTVRVKLFKEGNVEPRTYEVYNKETKETTSISAEQVIAHLSTLGLTEVESRFNMLNVIPEEKSAK